MAMTVEQVREAMDSATALYQGGQWESAADAFTELLLEPEALSGSNEMHWNVAMCFARLGNMELALQHADAGGYSQADFRQAAAEAGIAGADAEADARRQFDHAEALYQSESWEQAADAFTELLLMPGFPNNGMDEAHWNIGMCFARLGNMELAVQHAEAGGYNEADFRQACIDAGITVAGP
jgi:TolA-binding protein